MQFKDLLLPVLPFTLGRISGKSHVIVGIFVWPACLIGQLVYHKTSLSFAHGCAQAGRQFIHRCEVSRPNCTQLLFQERINDILASEEGIKEFTHVNLQ